jgi:hypothetical protein
MVNLKDAEALDKLRSISRADSLTPTPTAGNFVRSFRAPDSGNSGVMIGRMAINDDYLVFSSGIADNIRVYTIN